MRLIKKAVEDYIDAIASLPSSCCKLPGAEECCGNCPCYKIRVNQVRRTLMIKKLERIGLADKNWDYYKVWEQIIGLSNEMDELALFVCDTKEATLQTEDAIIRYLSSIIKKGKNMIKTVEQLQINREKAEKLIA